jgi:hypothetical protein
MPKISKLAPRALCALATAALVAALAVPAVAAPDKPAPCDGKYLVNDPAGDQQFSEEGVGLFATPENTDVLGYFYSVDGDKVAANIVVSNLDTTPMSGAQATRYRAYLTTGGVIHYVQALVSSSGATYTYGEDFAGVSYTNDGDTTGTLFEGKNGIVQIVVPPDIGGKVGTALGATSATAGELMAPVPEEIMLPPFYLQGDTAPDAAADGPTAHPAPCAAVEAGGPTSGGTGQTGTTTTPTISVKATAVSAKKASKKKSVTFTLSSSEALTSVTAKLKKGSTVVASGKLASLSDSAPIKLKLKQKKLKKGTYTLSVTGKSSSGAAVKATLKVKIKS